MSNPDSKYFFCAEKGRARGLVLQNENTHSGIDEPRFFAAMFPDELDHDFNHFT